ncbi:MAG: HEPN domain-containing protein [Spirochaetales bacterium]|nr:HEPN domain-containing protein [Spirochaetales bacterium]
MREPRAEALRWLRQAENDLEFARLGVEREFYAQVCFQCQQVCEKALKSIHYGERGERIVVGHSLIELVQKLDLPDGLRDDLAVLDQYYIPTRYPNGLPGSTPYEVYTQAQASGAVKIAETVIAIARDRLPAE